MFACSFAKRMVHAFFVIMFAGICSYQELGAQDLSYNTYIVQKDGIWDRFDNFDDALADLGTDPGTLIVPSGATVSVSSKIQLYGGQTLRSFGGHGLNSQDQIVRLSLILMAQILGL